MKRDRYVLRVDRKWGKYLSLGGDRRQINLLAAVQGLRIHQPHSAVKMQERARFRATLEVG